MLVYRSLRHLREKSTEILRAARDGDVVITRNGRPIAVLHLLSRGEQEAYAQLKSRHFQSRLSKAAQEARSSP